MVILRNKLVLFVSQNYYLKKTTLIHYVIVVLDTCSSFNIIQSLFLFSELISTSIRYGSFLAVILPMVESAAVNIMSYLNAPQVQHKYHTGSQPPPGYLDFIKTAFHKFTVNLKYETFLTKIDFRILSRWVL